VRASWGIVVRGLDCRRGFKWVQFLETVRNQVNPPASVYVGNGRFFKVYDRICTSLKSNGHSWGTRGRGFKSRRSDQENPEKLATQPSSQNSAAEATGDWSFQRGPIDTWRKTEMAKGTVKWFNPTKGYGFIQPQSGGKDVFVHISAVERAGLSSLNEGQVVEYEEVSNRGKTSAENLKVSK